MRIYIQKKTKDIDIEKQILSNCIFTENITDCDGFMVWHDINVNKDLLDKIPDCKWIVRYGTGYDNIDIIECRKRGIKVSNTPTYGIEEVSNFTIGLILIGTRNILDLINKKEWNLDEYNNRSSSLQLGIVGLGRIGTSVALKAKQLGFDVFFYDPYIKPGIEKSLGIKRVYSLNRILICDIISIHTPLTNETKNFIDLNYVIKNSIIINTARSGIINIDTLDKNIDRIKYFITDVDDVPLHKNIIKIPHMAFYTKESLIEMREDASNEMYRLCNNLKPYWNIE